MTSHAAGVGGWPGAIPNVYTEQALLLLLRDGAQSRPGSLEGHTKPQKRGPGVTQPQPCRTLSSAGSCAAEGSSPEAWLRTPASMLRLHCQKRPETRVAWSVTVTPPWARQQLQDSGVTVAQGCSHMGTWTPCPPASWAPRGSTGGSLDLLSAAGRRAGG